MRHHTSYSKGQTLIEVLVGLAAAVVVIAAIVSASINALGNSDFARDQNIASQYTQQGLEIIRDMRNQSIASLSATYLSDGTYCLASSCAGLVYTTPACWRKSTTCGQNVGKFVREVTVVHNSLDCNATPTPSGGTNVLVANVKIIVTTSWFDPKCTDTTNAFCHSVTASSCFSDFTVQPTP